VAGLEVTVYLSHTVLGKGKQPRLVELRFTNQQGALPWVVVAHSQAGHLATTHPGGVKERDRQAQDLRTQGGRRGGYEAPSGVDELRDLGFREDVRGDRLMRGWKLRRVRHEAGWLMASPVQAQVPHDTHALTAHTRPEVPLAVAPAREGGWVEVSARDKKGVEVLEHLAFDSILPSQRLLQREVLGDREGQERAKWAAHDRTCRGAAEVSAMAGKRSATSRRSSTAKRM